MRWFSAFFTFIAIAKIVNAANVQLAFGIMTYQKEDRTAADTLKDLLRIMSHIYEGEHKHVYVLHTDVKSDPWLLDSISAYCDPKVNCRSIQPRNVAWASLGTAEMMLALMQEADKFSKEPVRHIAGNDWEYFFLLGHESTALAPLSYIEQYMTSYTRGTNFVKCWKLEGYDFFGQWEENTYRLEGIVVDNFNGDLIKSINEQRKPPPGLSFYKSLQHVVLSREFVRFAVYGQETRLIMLYLANVMTSDEMLIPTLIQRNATLAATATCNEFLHYSHWIRPGGSWHPEYLTIEHLPLLLQMAGTSALFARKVNGDISTSLLQALDRIRNEAFAALQPETTEEKERDHMSPFVRPAVPLLVLDLSDPSTLRPVSADKAALLSVTADSPALSDTENSAILDEIKGGGITGGGSASTSHAGATGPFAKAMKWLIKDSQPSIQPGDTKATQSQGQLNDARSTPWAFPADYVDSMNWLVPIAMTHIVSVYKDGLTPEEVKVAIRSTGVLTHLQRDIEGNAGQATEDSGAHAASPRIALAVLDVIRRSRDQLETNHFLGYIESIGAVPPQQRVGDQWVRATANWNFEVPFPFAGASICFDDSCSTAVSPKPGPITETAGRANIIDDGTIGIDMTKLKGKKTDGSNLAESAKRQTAYSRVRARGRVDTFHEVMGKSKPKLPESA